MDEEAFEKNFCQRVKGIRISSRNCQPGKGSVWSLDVLDLFCGLVCMRDGIEMQEEELVWAGPWRPPLLVHRSQVLSLGSWGSMDGCSIAE